MGPNPNGPCLESCDRTIRYSGFFGVRSVGRVGDFLDWYLEDHPRTCKWLITGDRFCPLKDRVVGPLPNGRFMAYTQG